MAFDFTGYKETYNLMPLELPEKKSYYSDLVNLEQSWTGRVDAQLANTFIQESVQLIINAIVLFEKGYLDCAYYSLRQSLEVSTTMVYLMELEPEVKKEELRKWKNKSRFPMYGQMLKFLNENGNAFSDIKQKMENYFKEIQKVKEHLNKHVHKQGFNTFYVARNRISARNNDRTHLIKDFEKCLVSCIGAIAVFRLAIDPFPVLLMDYEIYSRTEELLTESYTEKFVDKYIGLEAIEAYKQTEIYLAHYEYYINEEERQPCVLDVVKYQHIDKESIDEILNQVHLLTRNDFLAVTLASLSDKTASIYCLDGLYHYTTSTKSHRTDFSFSSLTFKNIRESNNHLNIPYDEAFLSYLYFESDDFFVEHNEEFTSEEFNNIRTLVMALVQLMNQISFNNK
ncbi:teicoplanin resistance protein VanZ [Brevibacillus sp. HB1.3]|uniref:teicoplanin resistance protein VanZ n=1 Tax=Brevibacillus sp. HB1.3 TaxID=2738842 RepID=UPI0015553C66|nr:teicoplanin resistance protein VanZ [Brevibacillus sp. HB1.3]NQF12572.1 teicoplanin resistance protein VanZ [Brevibacillus sp. HB1.3]